MSATHPGGHLRVVTGGTVPDRPRVCDDEVFDCFERLSRAFLADGVSAPIRDLLEEIVSVAEQRRNGTRR